MMSCKKCQCGATPRYRVERGDIRGRRRRPIRERLVCPACGNSTGPDFSRHRLRGEWDLAAWCGQAEIHAEDNGRVCADG